MPKLNKAFPGAPVRWQPKSMHIPVWRRSGVLLFWYLPIGILALCLIGDAVFGDAYLTDWQHFSAFALGHPLPP